MVMLALMVTVTFPKVSVFEKLKVWLAAWTCARGAKAINSNRVEARNGVARSIPIFDEWIPDGNKAFSLASAYR